MSSNQSRNYKLHSHNVNECYHELKGLVNYIIFKQIINNGHTIIIIKPGA